MADPTPVPASSALTTSVQYPQWAAPTATQALASLTLADAASLVTSVTDLISKTNEQSDGIKTFIGNLPDPFLGTYSTYGTPVSDTALDAANFPPINAGQLGAAPSNIVLGAAPAAPGVSTISVGAFAAMPTYTQSNLGFVWSESMWDMSLLTAVQAKLLNDLVNGGYGIEPTDESALWQREREREQLNGESAIKDASRQAAARGMMIPPGVFFKIAAAARQAALEKSSSASRDIAMKRADLYVQNRQFTIEKAIETERAIVEYVSAYFGRQLDAMKANLEAYHLGIEIYQAQIEAYKSSLQAQEIQVRIQIEQLDAQVKIFTAQVTAYEANIRAQIGQAQVAVEIYKSQIQQNTVSADAQFKTQEMRVQAATERLTQKLEQVTLVMNLNKEKLAAMEFQTRLVMEPAQALASMATAYVGSSSNISATFA